MLHLHRDEPGLAHAQGIEEVAGAGHEAVEVHLAVPVPVRAALGDVVLLGKLPEFRGAVAAVLGCLALVEEVPFDTERSAHC
ncbi:hypothetical protein [Pseudodesulfovibrio piezophilus]|nr:hypothetical protein [Pseudodesulfovibrio piezophilus]